VPTATTAGPATAGHTWAGAVVVALVAVALVLYTRAGYGPQGVFLLFGAAFGVIFQRSRFCLVRAFREPFMTGDAEHTRAAALALVVATLGFAILKFTDLKDKSDWVFPAAGFGSLAGGLAFGVGMTLAGGCGAGSLWRAGEGQVKLWATVACFAVGVSLALFHHDAGHWHMTRAQGGNSVAAILICVNLASRAHVAG